MIHSARFIVILIYVTGLLLPGILGVIVRTILLTRGVDVVSWSEGVNWVLPLTIVFLIPFILLALLVRFILSWSYKRSITSFQICWYISIGSYAGMTLTLGFLLNNILQNIEAIAHWISIPMLIITIPLELLWAMAGVLVGGVLGVLIWVVLYKIASQKLHNT